MITVGNNVIKNQKNFWNDCIFHPTDAVEDSWGKRILDRIAKDKSINMVRVYAMFEDIVYYDDEGKVAYDFRLSDLRLDYLVEKGFDILIAYGMIPEILASDKEELSNVSKNKTRYKGKMLYTSKPNSIELWEEICYEYTKHIVERYGEDTVAKWHLHCYNEPDIPPFFMRNMDVEGEDARVLTREKEYFKMYRGFVNGTTRVSDKLHIGGPAIAGKLVFLDAFLKDVKKENLRLDYIALHNYAGMGYRQAMERGFCVDHWLEKHEEYMEVIRNNGFEDTELVYDEWGMAANGFFDVDECPAFIARETEVFSAYYAKLIYKIIERGYKLAHLMICLSGQHEMKYDFTGFRNFFSLNFFAKPIYNGYILASKLHNGLLEAKYDNDSLFVTPTKNENDEYAVLISYSSDKFQEDIPEINEEVVFENIPENQNVTIYCIDKENTNPYRLYERMGLDRNLSEENIRILREEGNIKPFKTLTSKDKINLKLTPNSVYLILTENKE